jgi:hypothetical protein
LASSALVSGSVDWLAERTILKSNILLMEFRAVSLAFLMPQNFR